MRADRLVATLLLMQSRGRITAAELAAELEVSVATARRDLDALSAAGVPVYPQPGRGGGWSLVGGARTDLSGLSATEAQALFRLVGPAASAAPEIRSALRKLVRALPGPFRADAEAAAVSVALDPTRWGAAEQPRDGPIAVLQDAVVRRRKIDLRYAGRGGTPSRRLVDPWGLVDKAEVWYLLAGTADGSRTFRVDRIVDVVVTDLPADRPADFVLADAWRRVVDEVEERRAGVTATVDLDPRFLWVLRDHFGRHLDVPAEVDGAEVGDRIRVRVSAPSPLTIAQQLAGWGAAVEVLGPVEVRAELARLGTELVARYADGPNRSTRMQPAGTPSPASRSVAASQNPVEPQTNTS